MDHNDIFEPNHLNSENIIVESYYDMDSDASNASSSASSTSSVSSVSSQKSNASTQSQRSKSIPWVETHSFKELNVADAYVSELTSTRDSTKPLCIFFDKLTNLKHKMLQQTRICRSKICKESGLKCDFKMKYQKCVPCSQAVVYEHGEHPVEQGDQETRRGIDEKVKKIIDTCIQRSVRTVRPIDVFVHLNLQKTRNDEMKDLPQPTLTQIQTYIIIV